MQIASQVCKKRPPARADRAVPEATALKADAAQHRVNRLCKKLLGLQEEDVLMRRYFISTVSALRSYALRNIFQLGYELVDLIMQLKTAQSVWAIEYERSLGNSEPQLIRLKRTPNSPLGHMEGNLQSVML